MTRRIAVLQLSVLQARCIMQRVPTRRHLVCIPTLRSPYEPDQKHSPCRTCTHLEPWMPKQYCPAGSSDCSGTTDRQAAACRRAAVFHGPRQRAEGHRSKSGEPPWAIPRGIRRLTQLKSGVILGSLTLHRQDGSCSFGRSAFRRRWNHRPERPWDRLAAAWIWQERPMHVRRTPGSRDSAVADWSMPRLLSANHGEGTTAEQRQLRVAVRAMHVTPIGECLAD